MKNQTQVEAKKPIDLFAGKICEHCGKSNFKPLPNPKYFRCVDCGQNYKYKYTPLKKIKFPGRNEECPCGSGKKFKNCCLNEIHTHSQAIKK